MAPVRIYPLCGRPGKTPGNLSSGCAFRLGLDQHYPRRVFSPLCTPIQWVISFFRPTPGRSEGASSTLPPYARASAGLSRRSWAEWSRSRSWGDCTTATSGAPPDADFFNPMSDARRAQCAQLRNRERLVTTGERTVRLGAPAPPAALVRTSPPTRNSRFPVPTVPAAGGVPVQVTKLGNSASAGSDRYPEFLPDGRHFVYTVRRGKTEESGIYAGSLDGKPRVRLLPDVSNAIYAGPSAPGRSGHLLFRRGDTLMAQPFDAARLRMSGDLFPVAEGVGETANPALGTFSLSENGTLAYGSVARPQSNWVG